MHNRFLLFSLLMLLIISGCKKTGRDFQQDPFSNFEQAKDHYFETPPSTNSTVKRIAEFLGAQNRSKKFVEKLIKFDGLAVWDKALIGIAPKQNESTIVRSSSSRYSSSSNNTGIDTIVYIPLVPQEGNSVYSFVKAEVSGDRINWRLYSGRDYDSYKHGLLKDKEANAEKLAAITMLLDNKVFGYTNFFITNPDLFKKSKKGKLPFKVTLNSNGNSSSMTGGDSEVRIKSDEYYWATYCFTYYEDQCPYLENGIACAGELYCDATTTEGCSTGECGKFLQTECSTNLLSLPQGNGGGGIVENPPPNYGNGGYDGIPGNGDSPDDPCDFDSPCGELGWTSDKALAMNLRIPLGIGQSGYSEFLTWISDNSGFAIDILRFINQKTYSDVAPSEKNEIAKLHYENLKNDPEYAAFVASVSYSSLIPSFSMIGLFKELAIEIGFKIIKKYIPGYGDWQSVKDAINNANHGDWIGMLGEIMNIVKKKVPWLAFVDAIYDTFNNTAIARSAWKTIDKIKTIPSNAIDGLINTLKNKCGGIIGNLVHDNTLGSNSIQGFIKYDPNDAENFFRNLAQNIGVAVNNTSTPGRFYFDVGSCRFNYYPDATSVPHYNTIEIILPNGGKYKLRFVY